MPHSFLSLLLITFLTFSFQTKAEPELEYEFDPYYSNVGLYIPFNYEKIPAVELRNEREIYLTLFKDAFSPSFLVIEFSINPLPILGVYLKDHQTELYNKVQIDDDLNLIAALTEGFEEPYALSIFLGNVIQFTLPSETKKKTINKGYSGFLMSFGDKHLRTNNVIDDNWFELEWKLKGDRRIGNIYHSFSFRVGAKSHDNENIVSSYYFGIRRELFNSEVKKYKLFDNIGVDFRLDYSRKTNKLIQSEIFIDKHWPMSNVELSFGIGLKKVKHKYLNELSDLNQDVQLILRPSIQF